MNILSYDTDTYWLDYISSYPDYGNVDSNFTTNHTEITLIGLLTINKAAILIAREVEVTIATTSAVLNLITIIALCTLPARLKTQLTLLLSLSVSDLIIATLHIVSREFMFDYMFGGTEAVNRYSKDKHKYVLASFCSGLYFTAQCASLATLVSLAADVLIIVKFPMVYNKIMSNVRGNVLVCSIWAVTTIMASVLRLVVDGFKDTITINNVKLFLSMFQFSTSILGFVAFIVMYLIIFCEICKHAKRSRSNQMQRRVKASVTIVIIVVTYTVCLMPFLWRLIAKYIVKATLLEGFDVQTKMIHVSLVLRCLYVAKTLCNPIIYAIRVPELKKRYKRVARKIQRRVWR